MTFTVEQKSQLAKLMATENLTVEHQKINTAKFDTKNRILYLPIWQNMSGVMYDLLCGHEVGHALYTPTEGWHDVATDTTKGQNFKSFLNVIEDARIEKKVKRRYPGLKTSFQNAYNELMNRDFFGIKNRDVNALPFIDRLNLYTKSQYTLNLIKFTAYEETLIRKVEQLETWEDVLKLTDEIYEYSKDEQTELQLKDFEFDELGDEFEVSSDTTNTDDSDADGFDTGDGDETKNTKDKLHLNDGSGDKGKNLDIDPSDEETGEDIDSKLYGVNRYKESTPATQDQFAPFCETDEAYRRNEMSLIDYKSMPFKYIDLPKPILKNIITPASRVQKSLTDFYDDCIHNKLLTTEQINKWVNDFKNKNDRYVGLLVKEFEMRKAAKSFSKSKLSDTGDIDVNKLSSYQYDDNIFRKVMITPKGKNHGLILLLDKSGSMSNNMAGSIEQIIVLTMFCRKVNIPFAVYGFGDSIPSHKADLNLDAESYNHRHYESFEHKPNHFKMGTVRLREYFNSKMSNVEYSRAVKNMIMLQKSFMDSGRFKVTLRPETECLSQTPMTQAIVATAEIMKEFRKVNNLDLTSLVIVHDGDADSINSYFTDEIKNESMTLKESYFSNSFHSENIMFRDRSNKFERRITNMSNERKTVNDVVLDWFKVVTGSKVFGFYLMPTANGTATLKHALTNHYSPSNDGKTDTLKLYDFENYQNTQKELIKQFKKDKFLVSKVGNYDAFYLVSGGTELLTGDDEIEIEGKFTANKLKAAFMKYTKKRAVNRVLVSKFIQGIAI